MEHPGSCWDAVLAYITNQLLHSHRAVDREAVTNDVDAEGNASQDSWLEVIPDLPRPDSEEPELVGFTQLTQKVDHDLPRPDSDECPATSARRGVRVPIPI